MNAVPPLPTTASKSAPTLMALTPARAVLATSSTETAEPVLVSNASVRSDLHYVMLVNSSLLEQLLCTNGNHDCEHNCLNAPGSYICSCFPGYRLASNGFSCLSKPMIT